MTKLPLLLFFLFFGVVTHPPLVHIPGVPAKSSKYTDNLEHIKKLEIEGILKKALLFFSNNFLVFVRKLFI